MSSTIGPVITHQESVGGESDSLEYFIKFPANEMNGSGGGGAAVAGGNNVVNSGASETDYVFVMNGDTTNIPIVLLLGWAGCQDKYLAKYSRIYEERGLITVRYTAPVENLFWKRSEMKVLGEKVLKLIFDMNFEEHPIFFHMFSNGGTYMYLNILLAMKNSRHRHKRDLKICGSIFDSAPGQRRFSSLYRALSAIYGNPKTCVVPFFVSVCLVCIWVVEDSYSIIKNLITGQRPLLDRGPLHGLKDETTAVWPHLFLYSKEDNIIPIGDIERFAQYRQEKFNVPVRKICFENSEHVKHFISHPNYYVQCVCRFINDCLTSVRNGSTSGVLRETIVTTTKID